MECITNWFRSNKSVLERKFKGRSAMITGAASGMGREMATLMAASGIKDLTICDMNVEGLQETVQMVEAVGKGVRVTWKKVDVCSEEEMQEWVEEYKAGHGRTTINFIVCNAGIAGGKGFLTTSKELWEKVFDVDFHGVVNTVRQWIPLVLSGPKDEPAHIVTLSSLNGYYSCITLEEPNHPYVAAKFAVRGFTESLMVELALTHPHVVVSCVHPGHVGTNIVYSMKAADKPDLETEKRASRRIRMLLKLLKIEVAEDASLDELRRQAGVAFRDFAPTTAAEAANIILTGVAWNSTRIRVGADAVFLDLCVRAFPRLPYTRPFNLLFMAPFMGFRYAYVFLIWRRPLYGLALLAILASAIYMKYLQ